jgi:pilus assembly protein CpaD
MAKTIVCVSVAALGLVGCSNGEERAQVAGWTLVDPSERHPILVSQQPQSMNVQVTRGSGGLTPHQRAELMAFAARSRASDAGNSKVIIGAPSGGTNEVAAMRAVHEIRQLLNDNGIAETAIAVEVYSREGDPQPPIRVSFMRYIAEGPQCGDWSTNLARDPQNMPYPNLGCTMQHNLAAMIANPADLLGPRGETGRSGERRDVTWDKYVKGDTTGADKSDDEKVEVDGGG